MPLIRNSTINPSRSALLTARLIDELRVPNPSGFPLVLENQIGQTQKYHVTVIWNEWADLALQARSRIILDAYQSVCPEKTGQISIAQGLTLGEAISMGMFPYKVVALVTQANEPSRQRAVSALKDRGAIQGQHDLELRFRTLEEAEQARNDLNKEVPGEFWTVVQEMSSQE